MHLKYDEYMKMIEPEKYGNLKFNYETMQWEKKRKKKKKAKKLQKKDRETIIERDGGRCVKCGCGDDLHIHHIIHRENGGTNNPDNLITLCAACHAEEHKGEAVYKIMLHHV